jgi:hypothetical protein
MQYHIDILEDNLHRVVVLYLDHMMQCHCPQQNLSDTGFLATLLSVTHMSRLSVSAG